MYRGILAIAWSLADPELLLSCGKDNRILCWNPNTAEVKVYYKCHLHAGYEHSRSRRTTKTTKILRLNLQVLYELPTSSQWCFDIQWCPRNPAVLSAASFDGHIDIYSIMGGSNQAQSQRHADQVGLNLLRQKHACVLWTEGGCVNKGNIDVFSNQCNYRLW